MSSKVTAAEIESFFASSFAGGAEQTIVELRKGYASMRRSVGLDNMRPGGYISGPTQMSMVDAAAYIVIFTELGITPMAVTTNLNINFLRPCIGEAIEAEARIIKIGRTIAVIEVEVRAEGSEKLSAHAVVNYALPKEA